MAPPMSNTQRLVGEEYYEIDQENNLLGYANGESTKEKGPKKYLQEKNKTIFYMFIRLYVNPQKRKVSELLAGECLEYDCDLKNCVILSVYLYINLPSIKAVVECF